jgi:putative ABC transport system permease protein
MAMNAFFKDLRFAVRGLRRNLGFAVAATFTIALLSYQLWQRRYGGDPSVMGRQVDLGGGGRALIVGVLAPDFEMLLPPRANLERVPDMWTAIRINCETANRNNAMLRVIGRLTPGVLLKQANAEVERLGADLRKQCPLVIRRATPPAD